MESVQRENIKVSVRNLVEFILRSGDIDNRRSSVSDKDAMQAGSRMHKKIQRQMGSLYVAEVSLKTVVPLDEYSIIVEGRADGIFTEDGNTYIDEIKGMYKNLNFIEKPIEVHKAQAMCYSYFYAKEQNLDRIFIQMTYCNLETEEIKRFREEFEYDYLENWFLGIINKYIKWTDYKYHGKIIRKESIQPLEFPFEYREGQRGLAVAVYRTMEQKKALYIQAPTGVGKTISTVFPAIKAIGEDLGDKLFYLTAKTITRTVAEETFELLREKGLKFKTVTITAKEKLCACEVMECNPDHCLYAKGHFDRVNDAVFDLINSEINITRDIISEYALKHTVCPFEMCLDVSNHVDGIICDYNYVFDPNVKLKRFFSEGSKGEYLFLIDEAHNLAERAREMYSAVLVKEDFLRMKQLIGAHNKKLIKSLDKCNKDLLAFKKECESYKVIPNAGALPINILGLMGNLEEFMDENKDFNDKKELLDFYFTIRNFLNIHDLLDDNYKVYTEFTGDGKFSLKLLCVNTGKNIRQCLEKGSSSVFFSATLLPIQYYKPLLGGNEEDYAVYADSPFPVSNRLILIGTDISSKYTRRTDSEFYKYYRYILNLINAKAGNYIVFFPSYRLMNQVLQVAIDNNIEEFAELIIQKTNMTEEEREIFLEQFAKERQQSLLAFCVLGGIFSEGIDLKYEQLIGTIIVGTGLPQVCTEREILKEYYDERGLNGFDYAYRYPGMNKILQGAGRVIRTEKDKGIIALLDDRFMERQYRLLFPREWEEYSCVTLDDAKERTQEFWEEFKWI
ncbi:MAG: ATP-dependent DNA helicase [Clostridiales bacterium]|nr:ATP-dependent DNA helicase [Clostridiales bacterium]